MDLQTILGVGATGIAVIGGVMTFQWLWFRPKIEEAIRAEVTTCREHREKETSAVLERIEGKVDHVTGEIGYLRSRVDGIANGRSKP